MRLFLFIILFALLPIGAFGQDAGLPALEGALQAAATDSARYDALIDLHNATFKTQPRLSREYAGQLLQLCLRTGDPRRIYTAYVALARCERKKRAYRAVLALDARALAYAEKSGSINLRFSANKQLANDHLDAEQYSRVLPYLQKAERIAAIDSSKARIADVNYSYAVLYRQQARNKASLPYFRKAIAGFRETGNERSRANAQVFMVEALVSLGIRDSTDYLIEDAMEVFRKAGSVYAIAESYGRLGRIFFRMGDRERGFEYYDKAREGFRMHHNNVEYALAGLDIAAQKLEQDDTAAARTLLEESMPIVDAAAYEPGSAQVRLLRADYYSRRGRKGLALRQFDEAAKRMSGEDAHELRIELRRLRAAHFLRNGEFRAADTLVYQNADAIVRSHDPEQTAAELAFLRARSKRPDSTAHALLNLLYTPGGVKKVQAALNGESFTGLLARQHTVQAVIGSSVPAYDSAQEALYHARYLEVETRYRARQMRDSLTITQLEASSERSRRILSNQIIAAVGIICLMLAGGLWLQRRYRRHAELHATAMQELNERVRHLTDNNLSTIYNYIDDAMTGSLQPENILAKSLKIRIAALILLNKSLYTADPAEQVSLQDYLTELADKNKSVFDPDGRISVRVAANQTVDRKTAGMLGIITAELLTNSYKYAFKGTDSNSIELDIGTAGGGALLLHYRDSGPGLPEVVSYGEGMGYIIGDSNKLRGEHRFYNERGLHFTLKFRPGMLK